MAFGSAELGDRCSSLVVVVDSWLGELGCEDTWWTVKFSGTCSFVESARVTRRRSNCLKLYTKSTNLAWHFDDSGMTMTVEQVVT